MKLHLFLTSRLTTSEPVGRFDHVECRIIQVKTKYIKTSWSFRKDKLLHHGFISYPSELEACKITPLLSTISKIRLLALMTRILSFYQVILQEQFSEF